MKIQKNKIKVAEADGRPISKLEEEFKNEQE